jgi:site-specific DNA recombinase
VYADEGISAKDITHRPACQAMLEAAYNSEFDIILIWALSRFTRSVADLYDTWAKLQKRNVSIISCTEGFDTSTPTGRAMMGVLGVFAQMERELTAERVSFALAERASQGKRTCSDVLGYNLDGKDSLTINETEAEVVRLIFQKFIEYQSYLPVAEIVNAMGHHGRRGSSFNAESIKKIVTRPVYIGYYSFKGHLYQGDYEPLISEKDWRHAQRIVQKIRCGRRKYIR